MDVDRTDWKFPKLVCAVAWATRGARLTAKARAAERATLQERARSRAVDLAPKIKELQAAGFESLRAIAAGLKERGIPAARVGKWPAVQVSRLLGPAGIPFGGSGVTWPQHETSLCCCRDRSVRSGGSRRVRHQMKRILAVIFIVGFVYVDHISGPLLPNVWYCILGAGKYTATPDSNTCERAGLGNLNRAISGVSA